jgi:CcdB protein
MAPDQFDVFVNPDPEFSASLPYFVVLQHGALAAFNTRIVAPLIPPTAVPSFARLMPEVSVKGSRYVVDVTNIGVIPVRVLQERVANLEDRRYDIADAIEFVFTGI